MSTHDLFVYGTLMRRSERGNLLGDLRRRPARVLGALFDLPAGYPALTSGQRTVFGELVEGVDDRLLDILDRYEGVDEGLYERRLVEVRVDTERRNAWTYWMADPQARGGWLIKTGRYTPVRRR